MARLTPVRHDDRLTVVGHLEELRFRLVVSLSTFGAALALCFWQNRRILEIVNAPLGGRRPATFGVAEPFTATLTVAAYAALALSLPVLLYQVYAYVLPAFSPSERHVAFPLFALAPLLFVAGASFAYLVVLPAALRFLLHFNQQQFDVQIRARDWYGFFGLTVLTTGVAFQVPVGILVATQLGLTTPAQLRRRRRHAIVICACVAAVLPGVDAITMLLELIPLVALYELGIVLSALFARSAQPAAEGNLGA
ncbi:MAG: twin-arginine translocase subunit TatC [Actinobacteria bacterium]|nr:twin-arginine translocase subunit TatC [Actinomycetota bacterium]